MRAGRATPGGRVLIERDDLGAVVDLLDDVFVRSQGRTRSLADRYPFLLREPDERVRIIVAPSVEDVRAVTVIRAFDWDRGGRCWHGAMIGMVATTPAARGKGLASGLLEHARRVAEEAGADFAVLWTTNPSFYRRLGWREGDIGTIGEIVRPGAPPSGVAAPEPLEAAVIPWIEEVRASHLVDRIERDERSYSVVPGPADRLELHRLALTRGSAYAVVGRSLGLSILYELVGSPLCFGQIWSAVVAGGDRILINGARDDSSTRWLETLDGIAWRPQSLAMWLPLTEAAQSAALTDWYVPFLDRI